MDSVTALQLLTKSWSPTFADLVRSAECELVLCSPFVSRDGIDAVLSNQSRSFLEQGRVLLLTNLASKAVCQGATDPQAVRSLADSSHSVRIVHLPGLHAKVYIADGRRAVITSANLTAGGLSNNIEFGLQVDQPLAVEDVRRQLLEYATLGSELDSTRLGHYCELTSRVRDFLRTDQRNPLASLPQEARRLLNAAEAELLRPRLAKGATTTVFAKTILYLLRKHGPLTTAELHPLIRRIHPDLCDDAVNRVIDGRHFGKKWKHAVRSAQQHLKDRGLARLEGTRWIATDE